MKELLCKHCGARREWHHHYELHCLVEGKKLKTQYEPWPERRSNYGKKPGRNRILAKELLPDIDPKLATKRLVRAGGTMRLEQLSPEAQRILLGISFPAKYHYRRACSDLTGPLHIIEEKKETIQ